MFIGPEDQAAAVLNDKPLAYHRREVAVHYIAEHPTPSGIKALVVALRDSELGIRWIAATALAQLGPLALPEVLRALVDPKTNTVRLREGVVHILHYSSNLAHEPVYKHPHMEPKVHFKPGTLVSVKELMTALKGPSADIKSMRAAGKLLRNISSSENKVNDNNRARQ